MVDTLFRLCCKHISDYNFLRSIPLQSWLIHQIFWCSLNMHGDINSNSKKISYYQTPLLLRKNRPKPKEADCVVYFKIEWNASINIASVEHSRETLSQHYHWSLSWKGAFEVFELDNKFLLHKNRLYGSINFTAIHDNICVISTRF